ncbi:IS21 family transposase, partial [Nonomuraea sp. 3N208]|uniref:IS21 family transposase n=1 Tax=Nonomuraea sp. 3N208 TaxID=3457421 RepID=UPI003FD38296
YLAAEPPVAPPTALSRQGTQPRKIDRLTGVVDAWLRADITLKASVIHERLVDQHGWDGHYQRVKMYCAQARPQIAAELEAERDGADSGASSGLRGLHRRFETVPGAQAQVDWGDEGGILAHAGITKVYSFHMVLSYSRDPFCCFTTSMDLATFWECHRRALAHFGGAPGVIVYDRTKTVVKRHVAPGKAVPLHPQAVAFAGHYGFDLDVLAAYRPTGKGRVERQVEIIRDHVLAGRSFASIAELDAAFTAWVPIRRGQVHRTHGEVIGRRAERDHAALRALPSAPYLVTDKHLRRVGKDCLISFEGSLYSVPARRIRARQQVELRVTGSEVLICDPAAVTRAEALLAAHPRASVRGSWVIDPAHWDGLPDGHTRAVTISDHGSDHGPGVDDRHTAEHSEHAATSKALEALLGRSAAARAATEVTVARRPLADYDLAAGLGQIAVTPGTLN